jgi:AcrR family transcriptional regulator
MKSQMDNQKPIKPRNREKTTMIMLQAARSLALEWGYNGLGINMIAKTAGYDKQLFYRYFGDWEGLLNQLAPVLCEGINWRQGLVIPHEGQSRAEAFTHIYESHLRTIINDKTQMAMLRLEAQSPSLLAISLAQHRFEAIKEALSAHDIGLEPEIYEERLRLFLALTWPLVQDLVEAKGRYGHLDEQGPTSSGMKKSLNLMIEALFS